MKKFSSINNNQDVTCKNIEDIIHEVISNNIILESYNEDIQDIKYIIPSSIIDNIKNVIEEEKTKTKLEILERVRDGLYFNNISFESLNNEILDIKKSK
jgi:hypothetical protein